MKINNSEKFINSSQRNNEFKMEKSGDLGVSKMNGYCMCNVTSAIMGLEYFGHSFPKGKYRQPEDNLCEFICTNEEVLARYKANFPKLYDEWVRGKPTAYWPNEVHDILCFGLNKWMGKEVGRFCESLPMVDFFKAIYEGHSLPTSMTFGKMGHIVCVVGFDGNFSSDNFKDYLKGRFTLPLDTKIIYDDPYSKCIDFDTGKYDATKTGNDNIMTLRQFIKYSKPLNEEKVMCHIIG